ncbi:MAG: DUF1002 domain-containing protein [Christensenellaceae bacterium]|jgi:uncharacterized protein YpuA (DUF1002 family)|nr:DUF1002 domain-containing protein [Christensenellaceae bacterium]
MKRILAALLALCILVPATSAFAFSTEDQRVCLGANLDEAQIAQIYKDFGIERGTVPELTVSNSDERAYLEGLVDDAKIGHVALSCVYIAVLEPGAGLSIKTNNINWCTQQMYINALTTAGISDAEVRVSAPFAVSGTAALTGVYKAYEDISGKSLSDLAKSVGAEELVLTGELAQYIGSEEATQMINELKKILDQTQNMSDDDVRGEIRNIAKQYNVQITDAQVEQLLALCRKLEKLDINALKEKLLSMADTIKKAGEAKEKLSGLTEKVNGFFSSVSKFISGLFGKK